MRSIALARLELDGYLLLVEQVGALEDDAKGALANLLADAVVNADDVGGGAAARHGGWGWESAGAAAGTAGGGRRRGRGAVSDRGRRASPEVGWGYAGR